MGKKKIKDERIVDIEWQKIFDKYDILKKINDEDIFIITANQIKEFKEPRLMTKFDSTQDLPSIFKKNKLAILPTKRGEYIIGKFSNYETVEIDNEIDVDTVHLPEFVTTIDYKNVSSEAVSLNSAFISGMIEDIAEEEIVPTIQGRMGTGIFNYFIKTENDSEINIDVENSQMEIDGSYEGFSKFIIVEAKNHHMEDFIVRQLYYPYRVWSSMTDKQIVPVMLIKHDNIYNFYIYEFEDKERYNSIKLKKIKRYIIDEIYQQIEFGDIADLVNASIITNEDEKIPFPQADSFYRILDIMNNLYEQNMSYSDISEKYNFTHRQAQYYTDASRYLGYTKREHGIFSLTEKGMSLMKKRHKEKNLEIVKEIISHKPFYEALSYNLNTNGEVDFKKIAKTIKEVSPNVNSESTSYRRAQTVNSWIKWILNLTTNYETNPFEK